MTHKLITHKNQNGSGKVYLVNGNKKHHIQNWDSFQLGQQLGLWGDQENIVDVPMDNNIKESIPFEIKSGFKFGADPLDKMVCTQKFGGWPDFYKKWGMNGHNGVDFRTKFDDSPDGKIPVYAVLDGTVLKAVNVDGASGYGKYIKLTHEGGSETVYAHLDSLKVLKGQSIKAGEQIGITDDTGTGTGAHLHFGFRPDKTKFDHNNGFKGSIDPIDFFSGEITFV